MSAKTQLEERYVQQITTMLEQARAWVKAHPEANPRVQFNYPAGTLLVAPVSEALKQHYVSVNDDGAALLAAMQEGFEGEREATVFMVRMAIEQLGETADPRRLTPSPCPHCGTVIDAAAAVNHRGRPTPGSLTVCVSCGEVACYDADLRLARLDPEEERTIREEAPETWQLIETIQSTARQVARGRGGPSPLSGRIQPEP